MRINRNCQCDRFRATGPYTKDQCFRCWLWNKFRRVALPATAGPGTELKLLIRELKLRIGCGSCDKMAAEMNANGIDWCRANREQIAQHLRDKAAKVKTWDKLKAAALAIASGLAFRIDPLDVYGSLVDEAIRRAEKQTPPLA